MKDETTKSIKWMDHPMKDENLNSTQWTDSYTISQIH